MARTGLNDYTANSTLHHRISGVTDIPRVGVLPDVASSAQGTKFLDAGNTQSVIAALFTTNAPDDVTAASRLAAAGPGVGVVTPGNSVVVLSDEPITRFDVVGTGSATAAGGGVVITTAMTIALCLDESTQFDFDSNDNIRSVIITMSDSYNAAGETGKAQATIYVQGFTHE